MLEKSNDGKRDRQIIKIQFLLLCDVSQQERATGHHCMIDKCHYLTLVLVIGKFIFQVELLPRGILFSSRDTGTLVISTLSYLRSHNIIT